MPTHGAVCISATFGTHIKLALSRVLQHCLRHAMLALRAQVIMCAACLAFDVCERVSVRLCVQPQPFISTW